MCWLKNKKGRNRGVEIQEEKRKEKELEEEVLRRR